MTNAGQVDNRMSPFAPGLAIWDATEVCRRLGIARSQYYRMLARGELPPRVQLSAARFGHRAADVERWVADHIQAAV